MFTWISGIQYFEMFPEYYALILTLRKSAPRVLAFLLGVLPVFLGFAYFGVAYFSIGSDLFADVDHASIALFALLNGDVIHDVFDNLFPIAPFISRLYLYTFIALFIYAVLNIFIAIVEDAFFAAKQETELEIEEDVAQKDMNIHNLDVVGLVAGPPVPVTTSMMLLNEEESRRMDSFIGSGSIGYQHPISPLASDPNIMSNVQMNLGMTVNTRDSSKTVPVVTSHTHKSGNKLLGDIGTGSDVEESSDGTHRSDASKVRFRHRSELSVPLISPARLERASKSERILLQTHSDPNVETRQVRHQQFLKVLGQMVTSYNKQFLNEIKGILTSVPSELRPPHSFDNYPCGFSDCVYCQVKTLLQTNLQTLRNNVAHSIENGINAQRMRGAQIVSTVKPIGNNSRSTMSDQADDDDDAENHHKGSM